MSRGRTQPGDDRRVRRPEWMQRARGLVEQARAWAERSILWQIWERLLENEFVDRSVALAAKAFVSFFPALLVVASFAPDAVRDSIIETLTRRLGVSGEGLTTIQGAFASSEDVKRATGILGLIFTFFYITSFTTALRRVYTRAWRRPALSRMSNYAIGASWLIGIGVYFSLIGGLRTVLHSGAQDAVFGISAFASAIGVWWITPWFMLNREVRLRPLLTTAVLTGGAMTIYAASASIWMPRTLEQNQEQFGFFGVTLALVTWLTGSGIIIVIGACAGPVIAADVGILGRLARGPNPSVLKAGAQPSLPAPINAPGLASAIGLRRAREPEDTVRL
jgi:membrane protein